MCLPSIPAKVNHENNPSDRHRLPRRLRRAVVSAVRGRIDRAHFAGGGAVKSLFENADERDIGLVLGAAVALHALVSGRVIPQLSEDFEKLRLKGVVNDITEANYRQQLVKESFALSREFWRQAEQQ